ncbi:MAG: NfeD family protein [Deltaproteobacteria bacterium]|nr:NfeD family protein [Deltaproteobacteria bacterium]
MCHLVLLLPLFALPVFWVLPFQAALPLYLGILAISLFLYFKIFKAMMSPVRTGQEAMLGKTAVVIEDIDPEGKIEYASKIWDAVSKGTPLFNGAHVKINKARGLIVDVEPIAGAGTSRHL